MAGYVSDVKKFDLEKPDQAPPTPQSAAMARAKSQAKKDSENDLSRATGDFSLYGAQNIHRTTRSKLIPYRILLILSWLAGPCSGCVVHCNLQCLQYDSHILDHVVDEERWQLLGLLHGWLHHYGSPSLGSYHFNYGVR